MKWALIGASDIASTRVIPALRMADQEVIGVMSSSADRARNYADANGLTRHTASIAELLSWPIDAVYISTTNNLHAEQGIAAAQAKKHVLCEKPLSIEFALGQEMVSQANLNKVILATNHHIRASGVHEMIRRIVENGDLGDIVLARVNHAVGLSERLRGWRLTEVKNGAGVVWDQLVHNVDTLRAALQSEVIEVTAMTTNRGMARSGVEDLSSCILRFANGVIASTCESYLVPFGRTSLELHGTSGSLVATDVMRQDPIGEISVTDASGQRTIQVNDRENLYVKTIRRFELACRGIGQPYSSGADGLAAIGVVAAVLASAQQGRAVATSETVATE